MPSCQSAITIDPQEWDRIYGEPQAGGKSFIFRRTNELAQGICRKIMRPGQRWVDLGCGTGHLMRACSMTGASIIGADHDINMIKFAKQRSTNTPPDRNLHFVVAQAEKLPFGDRTLDGVVATSVMGCLSSPRGFFAEAHRVLRHHGHAVLTFTNQASWLLKLNSLPVHVTDILSARGNRQDLRFYRDTNVTKGLESLGFKILRVDFYNFVLHAGNLLMPPPHFAKRLERFGRHRYSHWLARNFIVTARKIPA